MIKYDLESKAMLPCISVIICTHNPRHDYLDKVLKALRVQTLSSELWELLLIDNASEKPINLEINLDWHPQARHIREEELGLTPARLRGIREARAELLVFVDDDNVLDSDYLEVALQISHEKPWIGAWGGQIRAEFEVPPPEWAKPYLPCLAIREFNEDKWSNLLHQHETTPCGAGLCIRKSIAEKYVELIQNDPKRLGLDRKGALLISCGDSDLAFTACDMGFGTGQFVALKLAHLIPVNRLEEDYLLRLVEGILYSNIILESFRGKLPPATRVSWRGKLFEYYRIWRMSRRERLFHGVFKRAYTLAEQKLIELQSNKQTDNYRSHKSLN